MSSAKVSNSFLMLNTILSSFPQALASLLFLKDMLQHEAHRHPYLERIGVMYMLKLRHGDRFGSTAGRVNSHLWFVDDTPIHLSIWLKTPLRHILETSVGFCSFTVAPQVQKWVSLSIAHHSITVFRASNLTLWCTTSINCEVRGEDPTTNTIESAAENDSAAESFRSSASSNAEVEELKREISRLMSENDRLTSSLAKSKTEDDF